MYDNDYENKIRAQEIALFGGCLEDPKYSHGEKGVGFSAERDTRKAVSETPAIVPDEEEDYFEVRINFEKGECEYILIEKDDSDTNNSNR